MLRKKHKGISEPEPDAGKSGQLTSVKTVFECQLVQLHEVHWTTWTYWVSTPMHKAGCAVQLVSGRSKCSPLSTTTPHNWCCPLALMQQRKKLNSFLMSWKYQRKLKKVVCLLSKALNAETFASDAMKKTSLGFGSLQLIRVDETELIKTCFITAQVTYLEKNRFILQWQITSFVSLK